MANDAKDWDKREVVYTKAKIFDLIKSRELLQFSINKINQDITKLLKKLEDLKSPGPNVLDPTPAESAVTKKYIDYNTD